MKKTDTKILLFISISLGILLVNLIAFYIFICIFVFN
jgi:hypothetical protein